MAPAAAALILWLGYGINVLIEEAARANWECYSKMPEYRKGAAGDTAISHPLIWPPNKLIRFFITR
jgi:hypothetical protein